MAVVTADFALGKHPAASASTWDKVCPLEGPQIPSGPVRPDISHRLKFDEPPPCQPVWQNGAIRNGRDLDVPAGPCCAVQRLCPLPVRAATRSRATLLNEAAALGRALTLAFIGLGDQSVYKPMPAHTPQEKLNRSLAQPRSELDALASPAQQPGSAASL